MNYEKINENFKKLIEDENLEINYEESLKRARLTKAIAENSNLFQSGIMDLSYLVGLVRNIEINMLIDEQKLQQITGTAIYDNSIRLALYFIEKDEIPEYLIERDIVLIKVLKDYEIIEQIKILSLTPMNIKGEETLRNEFIIPIEKNDLIPINLATNELEKIIFTLSRMFELNYRYSRYIIDNFKYVDSLLTSLIKTTKETEKLKKVYVIFKKFMTTNL